MRMLRWMYGKTKNDKLINEHFREHLSVASKGNKIRETYLRWFAHVQHRPAIASLRKSLGMQVDGLPMGRGRPKNAWMEVVNMMI